MYIYEKSGKLNMQFGNKFSKTVPAFQITSKEVRLGSTIIPEDGSGIVTKLVAMNDEYFDTISEAIKVANGSVITLLGNVKENVVIAETESAIIDLNGFKIENDGSLHTIDNKGILSIKDSVGTGLIDNTVHQRAALFNELGGTCTLVSGTFNRTQEDSQSNTYYTILNQGTLTIKKDVTVLQNGGSFSSLIDNGWYDGSKNTSKIESVLIIEGGKFENGLNTLKNDDFGVMIINGGIFKNSKQGAVVLNWNKLTINGGEFIATGDTAGVLSMGYLNDEMDVCIATISNASLIANNVNNNLFTYGRSAKVGGKLTINEGTKLVGIISSGLPYDIVDLR